MPICQMYGLWRDLLQCLFYVKQHWHGVIQRNDGGTSNAHSCISLLLMNNFPPLPPNLLPSHARFLPCKTPAEVWEKNRASLYYYSQQGKLMDPFIILLMLAQSYCCPCLCCAPSTVPMRVEIKLKKLAFVSAASSYDSEHREPADLVSKMELLPTVPLPFVKNSHVREQNFKECDRRIGDLCCRHLFGWLRWQMRLSALPVLHGLNISRSLSTSQGLHIWALTMRDPELSMSSDLENFLLRPGGCCQNRLLYRVTQCCFQALPETK